MLVEYVKKVEQIWKEEGLITAESLSENDVIRSFSNLGILLSKEIIDVYSNIGGMLDDDMDSICFSFWTVERILTENKPNSDLTFFADFLINSHLYGFKFENQNTSSIHIHYGESDTEKIADSFADFFENFLTKPENYSLFGRESW